LEEERDVIEHPIVDDIDLNGWDVRKALRLFGKSNPAFVEWIQSPITYIEKGDFRKNALDALTSIYSVEKGLYHYRSMAKTNYRGYLLEQEVPLKKYFYALRPLLAARWIERTQSAAPIEFDKILCEIGGEENLLEEIRALLVKKMASEEISKGPRIDIINSFISTELDRLEKYKTPKMLSIDKRPLLNQIFTSVLYEVN
jgi:predicted nucleotidyltransferase